MSGRRLIYWVLALVWMAGEPHFVGERLRAFDDSSSLYDTGHQGSPSCVTWLLEMVADPEIKKYEGETPFGWFRNAYTLPTLEETRM